MDTIGNLIDKLTIANIRIWMAEDVKRNPISTPEDIVRVTEITNITNSYRTDLIQEIDENLNEMVKTNKLQKLYKQGSTKMYGK